MLKKSAIVAIAAPAIPMYAMMMPLAVFLPAYYAQSLGISMAAVGTMFALGRVFDVITDPFAGVLMDHMQKRIPRKVWLAIGAIPIALAIYNLFFTSENTSTTSLFVWLLILYVGWTFMSVALFSWAAETTHDYHERSKVMAAIQTANSTGSVLVLVLPVLVEWLATQTSVSDLRVQTMGGFIMLALPVCIGFALMFGPPSVTQQVQEKRIPLIERIRVITRSRALRRLLLADLAIGLNLGIGTSLSVFFVEMVLKLQARVGTIQLAALLSGLVFIPVWVVIAKRIEKHRALALTAVVSVLGGVFTLLVPANSFLIYFIGSTVLAMGIGGMQFLPRAIMADVLDHDRVETGQERAGLYYALLTTTLKVGVGVGIALAFYMAEYWGFDPSLQANSDSSIETVRYITGIASIVLSITCILAIWHFPIGRDTQVELRETIQGQSD